MTSEERGFRRKRVWGVRGVELTARGLAVVNPTVMPEGATERHRFARQRENLTRVSASGWFGGSPSDALAGPTLGAGGGGAALRGAAVPPPAAHAPDTPPPTPSATDPTPHEEGRQESVLGKRRRTIRRFVVRAWRSSSSGRHSQTPAAAHRSTPQKRQPMPLPAPTLPPPLFSWCRLL